MVLVKIFPPCIKISSLFSDFYVAVCYYLDYKKRFYHINLVSCKKKVKRNIHVYTQKCFHTGIAYTAQFLYNA
ncbi:hypothetical protein KSU1_D0476 [Candidatus Jettenia caeni]|uniref:Uncharacterized protein n=1 Tax=Candidatus Jettenia caeni TaxID=247490 RepID=I3IPZ0_9BACT|nr:MAG: hypothetical protein EDM77_05440 [Candidatus Jettenia sp. AMX1]MCE7880912.1 hypothetical protein [Candidatus Jettenia sp. AMX1]MCQ3927002.1 hypothetical protein [Candidatus Jettenia sp.]GAB63785.1 hypothetical protein KSU1_D0476 [Candidatus Jettenia caeni]